MPDSRNGNSSSLSLHWPKAYRSSTQARSSEHPEYSLSRYFGRLLEAEVARCSEVTISDSVGTMSISVHGPQYYSRSADGKRYCRLTSSNRAAKRRLPKQYNPLALDTLHIIHDWLDERPGTSKITPSSTPSSPFQSPGRWLHSQTANYKEIKRSNK